MQYNLFRYNYLCQVKDKTNHTYMYVCMYVCMYAAVTVEISILLICFCSFDLFCRLLDKDISIENMYIALSCPIK